VGLSTNKELSRGNATIDRQSVGVDGIGSHWFVMRTHAQGGIQRLVSFLEYSTHGHVCELSSTLERLLDGVNRQPTETRGRLPVVRLRFHDELRSGLHCLMVVNVMCTISTVDDEVDDALGHPQIAPGRHEIHCYQNLAWCRVHQSSEFDTRVG
jgi:hypothetical protein